MKWVAASVVWPIWNAPSVRKSSVTNRQELKQRLSVKKDQSPLHQRRRLCRTAASAARPDRWMTRKSLAFSEGGAGRAQLILEYLLDLRSALQLDGLQKENSKLLMCFQRRARRRRAARNRFPHRAEGARRLPPRRAERWAEVEIRQRTLRYTFLLYPIPMDECSDRSCPCKFADTFLSRAPARPVSPDRTRQESKVTKTVQMLIFTAMLKSNLMGSDSI